MPARYSHARILFSLNLDMSLFLDCSLVYRPESISSAVMCFAIQISKRLFFFSCMISECLHKLEKVEATIGDKEEEEKINHSPNLNLTRKPCRPKKLLKLSMESNNHSYIH